MYFSSAYYIMLYQIMCYWYAISFLFSFNKSESLNFDLVCNLFFTHAINKWQLSSLLAANTKFPCLQFNAFLNTLFSSPPTVGLIVAVLLDNTLEVERSKKDRGMPWWVKFRTFKGDNRNEEFYTLPFNLNRLFPPTWS